MTIYRLMRDGVLLCTETNSERAIKQARERSRIEAPITIERERVLHTGERMISGHRFTRGKGRYFSVIRMIDLDGVEHKVNTAYYPESECSTKVFAYALFPTEE